jgi:hypothetical protein
MADNNRFSRFNVPYRFNQIETALIAFCGDIEKKVNQIIPNTPVFVLQTGDFSYYIDKKFQEAPFQDIVQQSPRLVITFEDIQYLQDQNTNQYNKIEYVLDDVLYVATGRRLAVNMPTILNFVSPNFIYGLEHFEVLSTIVARDNVFTYEFLGNTYECAYVNNSVSSEMPAMEVSSQTRDVNIKLNFDLQIHLFVPVVDSIIKLSDTTKDTIFYEGVFKEVIDINTARNDTTNKSDMIIYS